MRVELVAFEEQHGHAPTYDDIMAFEQSGLQYLEAVTRETMRCKAVLMDISRQVNNHLKISPPFHSNLVFSRYAMTSYP